MDRSLVSVIVPAYNAGRFIQRTLVSVLGQTHRAIEVIVVDDGSTDDTTALVEAFARADDRVRLLQQPNGGVSRARNAGLKLARGNFMAPLDADDLWHPTKLEKQLACFGRSPRGTGVVYCYYTVIDENDGVMAPRRIYHAPSGQVYPHLAVGNIVGNASAPLIRRDDVEAVGGYDEVFRDGCEDLDFYLRLAERCDYALVPQFLVGYRRSRDSMSMNIPKMERAVAQLTRKMLARHPSLPRQLLRWRNGNMYRYLALHAAMEPNYRRFAVFGLRSVISDPLLLYGWVQGRRARGRKTTVTASVAHGTNFYAVDPQPTPDEAFCPTPLDARRHRATSDMRVSWLMPAPSSARVARPF